MKKDPHFSTKAIQVGSEAEQWTPMSVVPPIILASTYKQEGPGQYKQLYKLPKTTVQFLLGKFATLVQTTKDGIPLLCYCRTVKEQVFSSFLLLITHSTEQILLKDTNSVKMLPEVSDFNADVSMIREGGLVRHMPAVYPINHTLHYHGHIYHLRMRPLIDLKDLDSHDQLQHLASSAGLLELYIKPPTAESSLMEFAYSRFDNPNRSCLERCLAALEGAKYGVCFASGMGTVTAVTSLLKAGDHILCVDDIYGGTNSFFRSIAPRCNLATTYACPIDIDSFCSNIQPNTKMIWVESPTNPLMKITDIPQLASIVKTRNKDIMIIVDNTFLTCYCQKPLELGADISLYSVSKYLNGHSDVVMGAIILNDESMNKQLKFIQLTAGIVPSPFDCYLVMRSLKTLKLRMDQHMKSSLAVGAFLESHPLVKQVLHPGMPSHPQHEVAKRNWSGCSGVFSIYLHGGLEEATAFLKALKMFQIALSLGGYESLVNHPELMTHAVVPKEVRKKIGITSNLIRVSVGLESVEDLIGDLDQALKASKKKG
ncbi:hypothetical protein J6590_039278 [Homalodisca vitripennis]|nr:hypothetical protein J6590_039278 [Homalodisca vitripennis]